MMSSPMLPRKQQFGSPMASPEEKPVIALRLDGKRPPQAIVCEGSCKLKFGSDFSPAENIVALEHAIKTSIGRDYRSAHKAPTSDSQ